MTKVTLTAVIVDDEKESLHLLKNLLIADGRTVVAATTSDPEKAVEIINSSDPDILFLDIMMPGKSGFNILDELRQKSDANPYVVFTTAHDSFAIKAFNYAAFDYLLKPVEPERLAETIDRCISNTEPGKRLREELLTSTRNKLMFRNSSGIVFIDPSEIVYVEAEGNYSVFHLTSGRTEIVTILLGKVEKQLPLLSFFRINRSFVINLRYLKKVNTRQLQCILMNDGFEFRCSISRERVSELVKRMKDQ